MAEPAPEQPQQALAVQAPENMFEDLSNNESNDDEQAETSDNDWSHESGEDSHDRRQPAGDNRDRRQPVGDGHDRRQPAGGGRDRRQLTVAIILALSFLGLGMLVTSFRTGDKILNKVAMNQLRKEYSTLVQNEQYYTAESKTQEILKWIKIEVETSGDELKTFAEELQAEKNYFEAILFYHIAAEYYIQESDSQFASEGIVACTKGLYVISKALIKNPNYRLYKNIINFQTIPLMNYMRKLIQGLENLNKETQCLQEAQCLHHVELSERLVSDFSASKTTIKKALKLLETTLGENSSKHSIYGRLLNNLGFVYRQISQLGNAEKYYTFAIEAKLKAEDFTDDEKQSSVKTSEVNLRNVKEKLKAMK